MNFRNSDVWRLQQRSREAACKDLTYKLYLYSIFKDLRKESDPYYFLKNLNDHFLLNVVFGLP